jgi:7,8-dihydro-6-hydroxymethylpterin-pyrophosphokinase
VALARPAKGGTPWEFYYPPVSISVNIKHKSSVFVSLTKTSHDFQKFNLCVEYHVITRGAKYFECLFDVNIEFHLKDETITPLPMRPFHLLNVASGRVSLVRNVVYHERSNATSKSFISMASTRQQQTARQYSTERVKASPWSQHPLKTSHPTASDLDRLSKTPKNVTGKYTAYIALGSNLGNRIETIEKACNLIEERGIRIKRTSSLWETEPMYVLDQGSFVNGACEVRRCFVFVPPFPVIESHVPNSQHQVETTLEPLALLDALQDVENTMGRKKIIDKGPRNIDLDILLYDDQVVNHERLKVPHPLMFEREFVLRPLAEYEALSSSFVLFLTVQTYSRETFRCCFAMESHSRLFECTSSFIPHNHHHSTSPWLRTSPRPKDRP